MGTFHGLHERELSRTDPAGVQAIQYYVGSMKPLPKPEATDCRYPLCNSMNDGASLSFGLHIQPRSRMVSIVRRFVEESFQKMVGDPEAVFRVSLAVHELLENAAKYSVGEKTGLFVHFESDGPASVKLTNETTPEHIKRLRACIAEIQSSDDATALYQAFMRRSFELEEESGLGLARLRAEGELNLSLETNGTTVTITASCLSPKETRP